MPKKKIDKEKPKTITYKKSDHLIALASILSTKRYLREREIRMFRATKSGIIYSGTTYSGTTKSWLSDSRRCRTNPHRYPQLVELPTDNVSYEYRCYNLWNPPPPGLENINRLIDFAPRYYCLSGELCIVITGVSNPAFMVRYWPSSTDEVMKGRIKRRLMTHKSTEIDPYGANNQVVEFSYIIRSRDGKYYAISSQGAFFVMEETNGDQISITGICGTRAVPSSVCAKFFREYLFESRGEILIVFLIFRESTRGLADEIEVKRLDVDTLKLVNVDRLPGRALFLENDCCVWVDSREVGCKDNCVYFTGGMGDGWWMYDMRTRTISDESVDIPVEKIKHY